MKNCYTPRHRFPQSKYLRNQFKTDAKAYRSTIKIGVIICALSFLGCWAMLVITLNWDWLWLQVFAGIATLKIFVVYLKNIKYPTL
jgi:hypothetical protein